MWFESWESLRIVVLKGLLAYGFIVFFLRITGKRTLSKMNAFDLIVTVALGSTLANVLLSSDVSLAEGAVGMTLLILLQYIVTWLSVRVPNFQHLIKAEPQLLFHESRYLETTMKKERITREELLAAARAQGFGDMADVSSIVLETDGTLSVLRSSPEPSRSTLESVSDSPSG
jgi:uncharacterized membrane protein YcaP (DUF421 family)